MGQFPIERLIPKPKFDNVGIDYAGIIYGYVCNPTIIKSYVCVFVSLSVKAIHLELVSGLTTEATLRRFMARYGKPSLIMNNQGTNFIGAEWQIGELI